MAVDDEIETPDTVTAELLRGKLEGSGLIDTLDGMVKGDVSIPTTFSSASICGAMCASCIIWANIVN